MLISANLCRARPALTNQVGSASPSTSRSLVPLFRPDLSEANLGQEAVFCVHAVSDGDNARYRVPPGTGWAIEPTGETASAYPVALGSIAGTIAKTHWGTTQ